MLFWFVTVVVLILDQAAKYLVMLKMQEGETIPLIKNVFHLTYIRNPGAAFGMLPDKTVFFIAIGIIVTIGIYLYYRTIPADRLLMRISLGLMAGGAVGNLIDRIRFHRVVDFLDFRVFPVFNLADIAITVGVGLLILEILISEAKGA